MSGEGGGPNIGFSTLTDRRPLMPKFDDLSRSLAAFDENSTFVAAIEMGSEKWLVGAMVPGLDRDPQKKLEPEPQGLLKQLKRRCDEAAKARHRIDRLCVSYEA